MLLPKIGTPNVAELELPEMAMMTEESFQMDDYEMGREDLGYLAGQAHMDTRTSDYGAQNGPRDSTTDVRDTRTQTSRTEGERTQRNSSMDTSNSGARSEASPEEGGSTSARADGSQPSVMDRMSEFQAVVKKMTQAKNLAKVDRELQGMKSLRNADGVRGGKGNEGAEAIAGTEAAQNAANRAANNNQAADQAKAQQVRAVGDVAKSMKMTADQTPTAKTDVAMFTDTLKNEMTQKTTATPKVSLTKLSESAEVRDLIQTLKQGDSNEAVLRVEDTEAGNLEVHIRLDGADLAVQIRAEDVGLRRTMLDRFSSLESALASEGLVDGKVQVSEYDMGSSDSGTQSESPEEFNQKTGTQNQSGNGSNSEVSQESSIHDGLVHVVA